MTPDMGRDSLEGRETLEGRDSLIRHDPQWDVTRSRDVTSTRDTGQEPAAGRADRGRCVCVCVCVFAWEGLSESRHPSRARQQAGPKLERRRVE